VADSVDDVLKGGQVPHLKVGLITFGQATDAILATNGLGRPYRRRQHGLLRRHAMITASQLHHHLHRFGPVAGIQVGPQGQCHPRTYHGPGIERIRMSHCKIQGGQDHTHHAGLGQAVHLLR